MNWHTKRKLSKAHERIITAVRCMGDEDAAKLWDIIYRDFNEFAQWALIPEEEPDEIDLEMLEEIKNDPDCHIFISEEELKRSFGMI